MSLPASAVGERKFDIWQGPDRRWQRGSGSRTETRSESSQDFPTLQPMAGLAMAAIGMVTSQSAFSFCRRDPDLILPRSDALDLFSCCGTVDPGASATVQLPVLSDELQGAGKGTLDLCSFEFTGQRLHA